MSNLGVYLALQISKGQISYEEAVSKYSKYKEEIDLILEEENQ